MHAHPSILAVVVLYQCELSHSQTFRSLEEILTASPELIERFSLVVYDNSPQPQTVSGAGLTIHYVHDPSNGGLAAAYNYALAQAESEKREWLLLLDQDTSLTREFIFELLDTATALQATPKIAAIVPKLVIDGGIHSPATEFIEQMRTQFGPPKAPVPPDRVGIQQQPLCAYNSGSTLRVSALREIGGFPSEFWLDYLDHAVYRALYVHGYRTHLLLAALAHDASYSDLESVPFWRLYNVLTAQTLYVVRNGNFVDRLLYRIWLLRYIKNFRQKGNGRRIWKATVLQAFLLRIPKEPGRGQK
jgi:GT2 family glycosyltransferase